MSIWHHQFLQECCALIIRICQRLERAPLFVMKRMVVESGRYCRRPKRRRQRRVWNWAERYIHLAHVIIKRVYPCSSSVASEVHLKSFIIQWPTAYLWLMGPAASPPVLVIAAITQGPRPPPSAAAHHGSATPMSALNSRTCSLFALLCRRFFSRSSHARSRIFNDYIITSYSILWMHTKRDCILVGVIRT